MEVELSEALLRIPLSNYHFLCVYPGQIHIFKQSESFKSSFLVDESVCIKYSQISSLTSFFEKSVTCFRKKDSTKIEEEIIPHQKLVFEENTFQFFMREKCIISFSITEELFFELFCALATNITCIIYPNKCEQEVLAVIELISIVDFKGISYPAENWHNFARSKKLNPNTSWYFVNAHRDLINFWLFALKISKQ